MTEIAVHTKPNRRRPETDLSPPVKYFTDRSKAVLLLWIIYVLFCYAFEHVYLLMPYGHLLGKG